MKFIKNIIAVSIYLNFSLVLAICSILIMEMYLLDVPEVVPWGAEFGNVYYKLCISLIASYIFYFIVVHVKSQSDKENINLFVAPKVNAIINHHSALIKDLKKAASCEIDGTYLSEDDLNLIFSKINPRSEAALIIDMSGNKANWIQYLHYYQTRTQENIKKIFDHMPFLDSKLVRLIAELDDCRHFSVISATVSRSWNNTDMSSWSSSFHDYSIRCKNIECYYKEKLSQYSVI